MTLAAHFASELRELQLGWKDLMRGQMRKSLQQAESKAAEKEHKQVVTGADTDMLGALLSQLLGKLP